jgi:hypothetical protein
MSYAKDSGIRNRVASNSASRMMLFFMASSAAVQPSLCMFDPSIDHAAQVYQLRPMLCFAAPVK